MFYYSEMTTAALLYQVITLIINLVEKILVMTYI